MRVSTLSSALLAASAAPQASALLDKLAKQAGMKYFGAATDTPGQRERAGFESAYAQYDQIMWESGEFGQTTPTNGMKWLFTEPQQNVFNYTEGEVVATRAAEEGYYLRCHALVWHSQLAPWVEAKKDWTPDTLRATITAHITNVAGHWKGRCYAWDVVNEALNEDGTWRDSVFYRVLGPDFIKHAFRVASEVDPKAKLYYNDYNLESPGKKSEAAVGIVKMLKADGIKIDGIGMQAHLVAEGHPTLDEHVAVIQSYAAAGVEVALTELDVRLKLPVTAENLELQKVAYKNIVGACVQVKACIGVTLWDFYDPFSWVPSVFPGEGAPLVWFDNFTHHPAYDGIVEALKNGTKCKTRAKRERQVRPKMLSDKLY